MPTTFSLLKKIYIATLSTTFHSRTKSSSLPPPSGRVYANAANAATAANQMHLSTLQASSKSPQLRKSEKDKTNAAKPRSKSSTKSPNSSNDMTASKILVNGHAHVNDDINLAGKKANLLALNHLAVPGRDKKLVECE